MYLKITNETENHNGLQYHDGLNIDPIPFEKEGSCVPGGIYFTTPEYISNFLDMGIYVREVTIPEDAEMVKDPDGNKWRASKVILGERKDLREISTWEYLVSLGVDIHTWNDWALIYASRNGQLEVVKCLVSLGADIHADSDEALRWASGNGQLEVAKYLISVGADIHAGNDYAIRWASGNGHLEVVKYLVSLGADIHAENDCALRLASTCGYLEVVKYLSSLGADIHADNDCRPSYERAYPKVENGDFNRIEKHSVEKIIEILHSVVRVEIDNNGKLDTWFKNVGYAEGINSFVPGSFTRELLELIECHLVK